MYIKTTNSTNTLLRELIAQGNPPEFIYAGYQTAGRGQTGNGWESEPVMLDFVTAQKELI